MTWRFIYQVINQSFFTTCVILSYVYIRSVLLFLHVRVEMAEEYEFLQIIEKLP